jgi:hypothetical protein
MVASMTMPAARRISGISGISGTQPWLRVGLRSLRGFRYPLDVEMASENRAKFCGATMRKCDSGWPAVL